MINKLNYIKSSKKIVGCCKNENKPKALASADIIPVQLLNAQNKKSRPNPIRTGFIWAGRSLHLNEENKILHIKKV